MLSSIIFTLCLIAGGFFFGRKVRTIIRNIRLGRDVSRSDNSGLRFKVMSLVAIGQSKMVARPVAGFFHIIIYVGFIVINLEVLEIIIDGVAGTHRIFAPYLGGVYAMLIASFEYLAIGVLLACVIFLIRRNILKLKRFWSAEMTEWPRNDANIILITEIFLMTAFLTWNASDQILQSEGQYGIISAAAFPISSYLIPLMDGFSIDTIHIIERGAWWFHILGILAFLNYIPYSKHFHIFLAFPNVYYSNLEAKGKMSNMESVTQEVKLMFDPAATATPPAQGQPAKFGASDVQDLTWKNLMDSYSCTECGRCTSVCPANLTGKKLSPRKVMMDTRDRLQEVGNNIDTHGADHDDGKTLLKDYITAEELWACTTCNACVEACPVNIDPLSIILDLRRYLVMEQSASPSELNTMFGNVENNGAPWPFSPADRYNWANEIK